MIIVSEAIKVEVIKLIQRDGIVVVKINIRSKVDR